MEILELEYDRTVGACSIQEIDEAVEQPYLSKLRVLRTCGFRPCFGR